MNYNQRTLSGNGWGFNSGPVGREPGGGGSSVSVFNDLLDVNCPTPGDHHVPIYNLGAGEWQCGLLDLDQLDDVTLTAPALNNVLVRSFTDWVNVDFETFFASLNISIDKLGDVDLTGITTGQILQFNGTNLVPVTPSGGGNVTTASGVAPKLAYWTSVSNIEEVPIAEYDAANTLLKFNNATRSTAVFGHHFTNSWRLSWRNGGGTADLLVALDKSNRWIFSPSDVGNVNVDFAGFPGTGADQNFRFQNTSTGLGNLVAEGYIAAHQNSAFGGTLAASGAGRFRNNTFIGWRSTTNTRDVSFGVTNADFYLFDETTAGGGNTDLALNGGSATDWRIRASNVGSGLGCFEAEGWVGAHETNSFAGLPLATAGAFRLKYQGLINWRNNANSGNLGIRFATAIDRMEFGGLTMIHGSIHRVAGSWVNKAGSGHSSAGYSVNTATGAIVYTIPFTSAICVLSVSSTSSGGAVGSAYGNQGAVNGFTHPALAAGADGDTMSFWAIGVV